MKKFLKSVFDLLWVFLMFAVVNKGVDGALDFKCVYIKFKPPHNYSCFNIDTDYKALEPINIVGAHLSGFSNNDEVEHIVIVNRAFYYIPLDFFMKFPSVKILSVSNQLKAINVNSFIGATQLKIFSAPGNSLERLEVNTFSSLRNLIELVLNGNSIIFLDEKAFANLKTLELLSLHANYIRILQRDTFADMISLKTLSLSSNIIERLEQGLFRNNKKLEIIGLGNNKIVTISADLFINLVNLNIVDLRFNTCLNEGYTELSTNLLNEGIKKCTPAFSDLNDTEKNVAYHFNICVLLMFWCLTFQLLA